MSEEEILEVFRSLNLTTGEERSAARLNHSQPKTLPLQRVYHGKYGAVRDRERRASMCLR